MNEALPTPRLCKIDAPLAVAGHSISLHFPSNIRFTASCKRPLSQCLVGWSIRKRKYPSDVRQLRAKRGTRGGSCHVGKNQTRVVIEASRSVDNWLPAPLMDAAFRPEEIRRRRTRPVAMETDDVRHSVERKNQRLVDAVS